MSALPEVLFTFSVPASHLSPLDGIATVRMLDNGLAAAPREQVLAAIGNCTGLISQGELRVDAELLDAAPNLKIVANAAMGIDNLDLAELRARGIAATNTPDAFAESTADHTLGLILAFSRKLCLADHYVRSGAWAEGPEPLRWEGTLLRGKTLGLVGYGRIARMVETRALAFGMEVVHTRSTPGDHPGYRDLDALLASSDFVVVLVPLSDQTRHLADATFFARMKPDAVFLNLARGPVMDEAALVDALTNQQIAGAALDVFEREPVVNEALFGMDKVVLTPHVGGATREQREAGRREAAENVARFLRGEPLLSPL